MLEVCIDSIASALAAEQGGARRVELCSGLIEGGVTPSEGLISAVRSRIGIDLYVLIRPRGGDFYYSDSDFEVMLRDVHTCGMAGCNGVVIGALRSNGTVDAERCKPLVDAARRAGMGVTFHRAIDRSASIFDALEAVISLGCDRILTSGGMADALAGAEVIKQMVRRANGRISIMAGAGITPQNAAEIIQTTGVREIHGTLRSSRVQDIYQCPNFTAHNEYELLVADVSKIKAVAQELLSLPTF